VFGNQGELRQVVGKEVGQIAAYGFLRDAKGNKVFKGGIAQRSADLILFGSALPKWVEVFLILLPIRGSAFLF